MSVQEVKGKRLKQASWTRVDHLLICDLKINIGLFIQVEKLL